MNKHTIKKLFKKTLSIAAFMLLLFQVTCVHNLAADNSFSGEKDIISFLDDDHKKDNRN